MTEFKYLGNTVNKSKLHHDKINNSLCLGNECCCLVQNLLLSNVLSKNFILVMIVIILSSIKPVETWYRYYKQNPFVTSEVF